MSKDVVSEVFEEVTIGMFEGIKAFILEIGDLLTDIDEAIKNYPNS